MRVQMVITSIAVMAAAATVAAQSPPPLTLADAEQTALHNHQSADLPVPNHMA